MMKILVFVFFAMTLVQAADRPKSFTIMLSQKNEKIWYQISQKGKLWVCQTKHFPYFESEKSPIEGLDWKLLESESKAKDKNCKDLVGISDNMTQKDKKAVTCLDQPHTQMLYVQISSLCKSKI